MNTISYYKIAYTCIQSIMILHIFYLNDNNIGTTYTFLIETIALITFISENRLSACVY